MVKKSNFNFIKPYTLTEWKIFEEKQHEAYCKRTGRPYTPRNLETPETKKSLLTEDWEKATDYIPKKKKSFWNRIF